MRCYCCWCWFCWFSFNSPLKKTGISVKVLDKASEIGGTWAWNRYPGAATDSEGYYYCLTFSKEILQEWTWSERYPGWEETNRYLNFVADKCDMWPHIQLNTEVKSAEFNKEDGLWIVKTNNGEELVCKYFISAMGMISQPVIPSFDGIEDFNGPCFHSSRWPQEGLDYDGKKVGYCWMRRIHSTNVTNNGSDSRKCNSFSENTKFCSTRYAEINDA